MVNDMADEVKLTLEQQEAIHEIDNNLQVPEKQKSLPKELQIY